MPAPKHREARSPIIMPIGMPHSFTNYIPVHVEYILHLLRTTSIMYVHLEHNYNQKKNETVLFAGVIDAQCYLLDVNDEGSFRSARGTQYLAVCTEEGIKVCTHLIVT